MKIIAVVASLYGMLQSLDHWMFFTYFTNLSNIFIDIMLVIFIIYDLKKAKYIPQTFRPDWTRALDRADKRCTLLNLWQRFPLH